MTGSGNCWSAQDFGKNEQAQERVCVKEYAIHSSLANAEPRPLYIEDNSKSYTYTVMILLLQYKRP